MYFLFWALEFGASTGIQVPGYNTNQWNVASLSFFYRYYFSRCSFELAQVERSAHYSVKLHDFSVTIPRYYNNVYFNSFFLKAARLWNSLPVECFPSTYNLNGFKSRINRYHLQALSHEVCNHMGLPKHCLNLLRHAFCWTTKMDMNPSRQVVFPMPRLIS